MIVLYAIIDFFIFHNHTKSSYIIQTETHLPLVVPLPLLRTIGILFPRFQATLGSGYPLASHLRWTDAPSATMVSLDVSLYKMSGASTTLSIPI